MALSSTLLFIPVQCFVVYFRRCHDSTLKACQAAVNEWEGHVAAMATDCPTFSRGVQHIFVTLKEDCDGYKEKLRQLEQVCMYGCVCPTCMHLYSPCPRVHAHMHTLKHLTHVRMHTHPSMSTSLTNKLVSVVFVLLSHNSIVSFSFGCTCSMNMCTHAHTYIHTRTHTHTYTHRAKIYSYRFASTSSKLTAW